MSLSLRTLSRCRTQHHTLHSFIQFRILTSAGFLHLHMHHRFKHVDRFQKVLFTRRVQL